MARLITSGFEAKDFTIDGVTLTGAPTIVTTTPRSGTYCMSAVTASAVTAYGSYAFTGALSTDYWARFGLRISANPANAVIVASIFNTTPAAVIQVRLNTNGTLDLLDSAGTKIGSSSAALTTATWYRIEVYFDAATSSTGKCELRVNDTTVTGTNVSNANLGTVAPATLRIGVTTAVTSTATLLFDDIALNNGTAGAGGTTWPGEGKIVLLNPTADSAVGTGWTNDNAASTGLFASVDNEPPVGIADTTTGGGGHQVRNATANANTAYNATLTTYTAAGLASTDAITLLQWTVATGALSATQAKSGSARILTNPVDTGLSTLGTFYQGSAIAGTYPTGWKVTDGPIFDSSNVTLPTSGNYGTAPTMSLNQVTSSTRVAMCCFMGVTVEYQKFTPLIAVNDAVVATSTDESEVLTSFVAVADSTVTTDDDNETLISLIAANDAVTITEPAPGVALAAAGPWTIAIEDDTITSDVAELLVPWLLLAVEDDTATAESSTALLISLVVSADAIAVTEASTTLLTSFVAVNDASNDAATVSETISVLIPVLLLATSDQITTASTDSESLISQVTTNDAVSTASVDAETLVSLIAVQDTAGLTDAPTLQPLSIVAINDATVTVDQPALSLTSFVAVNDATTTTSTDESEMLVSFVVSTDAASITEAVNQAVASQPAVNDATVTTDSVGRTLVNNPAVNDTTTTTDTVAGPQMSITIPGAADTVSVGDSALVGEQGVALVATGENVTTSEAIGVQLSYYSIAVNDVGATSETSQEQLTVAMSGNDSVTSTETFTPLLVSFVGVSDASSTADSPVLTLVSNLAVSDSTAVSDVVVVKTTTTYSTQISDSATTTEQVSIVLPWMSVTVNDAVVTFDSVQASATALPTICTPTLANITPYVSQVTMGYSSLASVTAYGSSVLIQTYSSSVTIGKYGSSVAIATYASAPALGCFR